MTRVTAPSRLHFGLLNVPTTATLDLYDERPSVPLRHFGGVGMMVAHPALVVRVEPAPAWDADGPLAVRALAFGQRFMASLSDPRPFRIVVEHAPAEHTGLGVGTQLGLAVAQALANECGLMLSACELAERVGRGERSAIGVHGFARGGLIVEAGKRANESVSPLVAHYDVPASWLVVLLQPDGAASWHGHRERSAFAKLSQLGPTPAECAVLCRLLLMGIMPALASRHFADFSAALYEFNARVGDLFAPAQGGRYGSPAIADVVQRVRALGIEGVGQSSWGPTVFAFVRAADVPRMQAAFPDVPHLVTQAASAGATLVTGGNGLPAG